VTSGPAGGPVRVSLRVQGTTLRLTAHGVTSGDPTMTALANLNAVNEVPSCGRAYTSQTVPPGTDLSLGLPVVGRARERPDVRGALELLRSGAVQLRSGRIPQPPPPPAGFDAAGVLDAAARAMAAAGEEVRPDGHCVVRLATVMPSGDRAALSLFVDGSVLVCRAVPGGAERVPEPERLLRALDRWNARSAAGAAVWSPELHVGYGVAVLHAAWSPVDPSTVSWLVAQAVRAADAVPRVGRTGDPSEP
jgi:hypothetical protein